MGPGWGSGPGCRSRVRSADDYGRRVNASARYADMARAKPARGLGPRCCSPPCAEDHFGPEPSKRAHNVAPYRRWLEFCQMDFERLKRGMADIVEIAQTVPEPFRERCFDALLTTLLNEGEPRPPERAPTPAPANGASPPAHEPTPPPPAAPTLMGSIPLKGQMRVFLQRTNISEATLGKVVS